MSCAKGRGQIYMRARQRRRKSNTHTRTHKSTHPSMTYFQDMLINRERTQVGIQNKRVVVCIAEFPPQKLKIDTYLHDKVVPYPDKPEP